MIGRRKFVALLGSAAAARPVVAGAQQQPSAVIGFLSNLSPDPILRPLAAFRRALQEAGYIEGQNLAVEFRFAEGRNHRLAELAADLVRRQVAVIVATGGGLSALAAKAETGTIPIVFSTATDPVRLGLVASLNHPGGNATGCSSWPTHSRQSGLGYCMRWFQRRRGLRCWSIPKLRAQKANLRKRKLLPEPSRRRL